MHCLFVEHATAASALAYRAAEKLSLQLAMLTDDEHGATLRYTEHQRPRTKVAIFDPALILLNVLEHLRKHAAFLGMTILAQQHVGNQHALLVEDDQGVPR
jgi:hypothetical protein